MKPILNFPKATGGWPTRRSSASASSASPEQENKAMLQTAHNSGDISRRQFVHTTGAAAAALTLPTVRLSSRADVIRVGAIGCGGRGTGAIKDCLTAAERVELVGLGGLFPDRPPPC